MAAFIPALLGLGSSLAGGIAGQVQRRRARKEIEDTPLAARAQAEANARNIQRQAIGQRTTNPMAALRSASQLGIREREAGNVAAAREQTVRNQLIAQMRQGEANQLQQVLGGLGRAGGLVTAQALAGQEPDAEAGLAQAALQAPQPSSAAEPVDPIQAPTTPGGLVQSMSAGDPATQATAQRLLEEERQRRFLQQGAANVSGSLETNPFLRFPGAG